MAAGIADGALPRSTADERNDGHGALMTRRGCRRGHHRSRSLRLIRVVGQIGGRTLGHQTGYHGCRSRRSGDTAAVERRQDPLRRRSIADQTVLNTTTTTGTTGRQDHRTVADLSDRRYETILTYTSCHTVTVATRYKTNGITAIATTVRMYTIVAVAAGATILLNVAAAARRWDDRDFTAQSVRRRPMVLILLLEKLSRLK